MEEDQWGYDLIQDSSFDFESSDEYEEPVADQPPFWYAHEDKEQLEGILLCYSKFCKSSKKLSNSSDARRLPEFVGKILRFQVLLEDEMDFCTYDQVEIYRRDLRCVGSSLTKITEKNLLTRWDVEQGLPLSFTDITGEDIEDLIILFDTKSYIHCLPVWATNMEYQVTRGDKDIPIGYAKEPFNFTKYLPKEWLEGKSLSGHVPESIWVG
eukprot:TRINITY_DN2163_c0_g1_i3.p1 TRINITY_DN2163_c0_g1~~TRINITY_DN2163_c0_g1_i3.p1  ORF type:complete len:231 (+),score=39.24 TRINITY_DN2163_c0_g1_i3:61-693(+)